MKYTVLDFDRIRASTIFSILQIVVSRPCLIRLSSSGRGIHLWAPDCDYTNSLQCDGRKWWRTVKGTLTWVTKNGQRVGEWEKATVEEVYKLLWKCK